MRLECISEKLKSIVAISDRITGKNVALPALSSILLIASGKSLKVRATNLSLGIEIEIPAKVEEEGTVAITGAVLNSFLGNIPNSGSVTLSAENDNIRLSSKTSNALIKCVPYDDFPTLPTVTGQSFTVPAEKLLDGFRSVMFAGAVSDIKPEIASVYVYVDNSELVFVSTDSFRLAEKKIKIKEPIDISPIIIPLKNVVDIVRTLESGDNEITITVSEHQISFVTGGLYVTSRLINGIFPDYRQIIPKDHSTDAVVLKSDLTQALKLSNVFSGKFNQITFTLDPENKICSLSSKNSEVGEQKTEVAGAMKGNKIEVLVNYRYLSEVLNVVGSDSISIECSETNRPIVVRGIGETNFLYLMMPMNR
ncbi:MAG TPA: DNA polymerase III subunit beta [Candidatus Paceibacterota bacterium]|nr:DNA polymerase III subunit beta [Candidatus Paceibacterota bacterium]